MLAAKHLRNMFSADVTVALSCSPVALEGTWLSYSIRICRWTSSFSNFQGFLLSPLKFGTSCPKLMKANYSMHLCPPGWMILVYFSLPEQVIIDFKSLLLAYEAAKGLHPLI